MNDQIPCPLVIGANIAQTAAGALKSAVEYHQRMGRTVQQSDIPGLWNVTGFPELTTGQLLSIAKEGRLMPLAELTAPNGWFLHRAAHEHTSIVYGGDKHEPLPHADGPWIVEFQRYPSGGLLTKGRGHTLTDAWQNACAAVLVTDAEYPREKDD